MPQLQEVAVEASAAEQKAEEASPKHLELAMGLDQ